MDNKNDKKTKLFLGMILAIIILLVFGVVYQFIRIKQLEKMINQTNSSCITKTENYDFDLQRFSNNLKIDS